LQLGKIGSGHGTITKMALGRTKKRGGRKDRGSSQEAFTGVKSNFGGGGKGIREVA